MKKLYTRCTAALCSVIKKSNLRLGMLKGAHRYVIPLLLFLMSMVTVPVLGQTTATVADGPVTNAYIPFYGWLLVSAR